ncbi:MAG TPA: UvrD-helicase domain-containing protein [Tepidisphaeraceae bacterium]
MIDTEQLLSDLTPEQAEAVRHVDGPLLIVAGAGSGKTRVITRRVAYLVGQGIPPASILAITFTNKAAGEMKQRVGAALDRPVRDFGKLQQPWPLVCTFHSLCMRILRHYAERIGLPGNFSIYDSADQTKLIKDALKQLEMSSTNFPPANVHHAISAAKNQLMGPADYAGQAGDFYSRQVSRIYTKYQSLLEQNGALDFDDLLLKTAEAFRKFSDVLAELQERFQYILIDEYQDTNKAQYIIAHALAHKHQNICVVGDPDQSIYAWRGADIRNILEFEHDYPNAKIIKLERNYRSTKNILRVASELISKNTQRKKKDLWTENPQGELIQVVVCQDEDDEARVVARAFKEMHEKQQIAWGKMAIFYRMNSLSRAIEDAIRMEGIPYVVARGTAFYERKEVKDVLAYLRVVANMCDEVNLERIVNTPPRGLGDMSIRQIQTAAVANGVTMFEMLERAGEVGSLSARAVSAAQTFAGMVRRWQKMAGAPEIAGGQRPPEGIPGLVESRLSEAKRSVREIMEDVVRTAGIEEMLRKKARTEAAEDEDPLGNVNGLITEAAKYDAEFPEGSLEGFLANVSLRTDADALKDDGGAVTLMTLHAAKGLEFPVVAMVGLEEGVLPHARARDDMSQMEEERRLCFVGITRAQEKLIMTKSAFRTIRGLRERTVTSPFFNEMPLELLAVTDRTQLPGENDIAAAGRSMLNDTQRAAAKFRVGILVRHPSFGLGRISDLSDTGSGTRVSVQFNTVGRKTLILEYARLEPVDEAAVVRRG